MRTIDAAPGAAGGHFHLHAVQRTTLAQQQFPQAFAQTGRAEGRISQRIIPDHDKPSVISVPAGAPASSFLPPARTSRFPHRAEKGLPPTFLEKGHARMNAQAQIEQAVPARFRFGRQGRQQRVRRARRRVRTAKGEHVKRGGKGRVIADGTSGQAADPQRAENRRPAARRPDTRPDAGKYARCPAPEYGAAEIFHQGRVLRCPAVRAAALLHRDVPRGPAQHVPQLQAHRGHRQKQRPVGVFPALGPRTARRPGARRPEP